MRLSYLLRLPLHHLNSMTSKASIRCPKQSSNQLSNHYFSMTMETPFLHPIVHPIQCGHACIHSHDVFDELISSYFAFVAFSLNEPMINPKELIVARPYSAKQLVVSHQSVSVSLFLFLPCICTTMWALHLLFGSHLSFHLHPDDRILIEYDFYIYAASFFLFSLRPNIHKLIRISNKKL